MKKISTLISMALIAGVSFGQSQRFCILEEFTQASCGPCAAQNPALNTLLNANPTKVVGIKYQVSWPGYDPMNLQNPTQVSSRVTYYGVTGVPNIRFDGNITTGAPSALTQTIINNEYAVVSPFTIALSHSFSSDYDSVFISATITASQAVTFTGPVKAHMVLREKQINFATAPGSNGETVFYGVMKQMLPSDQGTTLATSWTVGQNQVLTFAEPIPSYVYNLNNFDVVCFVQDNSNKNVKQGALSAALVLPPSTVDAGVSVIGSLSTVQCVTTIAPVLTIKNYGTSTMTSCDVNYQIDGGPVNTIPWTGSVAPNGTTTVNIPSTPVVVGSHTFKGFTSNPNGSPDYFLVNNSMTKNFTVLGAPIPAPIVEGYQAAGFPPAGWVIDDPNNSFPWMSASVGCVSTKSAEVNFYNDPAGNIEEFYAPPFDFTAATAVSGVDFDVAYAQYTNENDRLEILISTNCGTTWTSVYNKAGAVLKTAPPTTANFVPTASQWRHESVNLGTYAGQSNVLMKLKATSAYGNNLYVDNVNIHIASTSGINEPVSGTSVNVYPNPFSSSANIDVSITETQNVTIKVLSYIGELVSVLNSSELAAGNHTFTLDGTNLSSGIYFVTLTAGESTITKKISLNK